MRRRGEYRRQYGDLLAPKRYKTGDGLSLGSWLSTQRAVRSGRVPGALTRQQIARLDVSECSGRTAWSSAGSGATPMQRLILREFGDLDVPARYVAADGFALGKWIINCRQRRAGNAAAGVLTNERIARLDAIGMIWRPFSLRWEQNYLAAAEYYAEHGDLEMPLDYCTPGGLALGKWIFKQRALRAGTMPGAQLQEEQIARLDAIGMRWGNKRRAAVEPGIPGGAPVLRTTWQPEAAGSLHHPGRRGPGQMGAPPAICTGKPGQEQLQADARAGTGAGGDRAGVKDGS